MFEEMEVKKFESLGIIKRDRSILHHRHELIFAVKQITSELEDLLVNHLSNPKSQKFQQWLSFEEVGKLTSNLVGTELLIEWLVGNDIIPSKVSIRGEYIFANTTIDHWERLLRTQFHQFQWHEKIMKSDEQYKIARKIVNRCNGYQVPSPLNDHLSTVFYTVQPPSLAKYLYPTRVMLSAEDSTTSTAPFPTTPSFLNVLYQIPNQNIGSSSRPIQSVFSTNEEYFSPSDLSIFQSHFNLPQISVVANNGYSTTLLCSTSGAGPSCNEGNLDVQYLTGMSGSPAIYWYVPSSSDPFVVWYYCHHYYR